MYDKLKSVVSNLQRVWELDPDYLTVQRENTLILEYDDWLQKYVAGCRPFILYGLLQQDKLKRFKLANLKGEFENEKVQVQNRRDDDPLYEERKHNHTEEIHFADFVDEIMEGPTNNVYLTANNELLKRAPFSSLLSNIQPKGSFIVKERIPQETFLWIGGAGVKTPCHHDTVMLFHYQVEGRKRWRFVSPLELLKMNNSNAVFSPNDLSCYNKPYKTLECVVEPGEAIFLPLGWWHQVESLDVTVSLSFSCLPFNNSYQYANP
jgi:hypothetical protein